MLTATTEDQADAIRTGAQINLLNSVSHKMPLHAEPAIGSFEKTVIGAAGLAAAGVGAYEYNRRRRGDM